MITEYTAPSHLLNFLLSFFDYHALQFDDKNKTANWQNVQNLQQNMHVSAYPQSESKQTVNLRFSINSISTEKAVAPHSSTLAWKIPWTEEPGGLQSMGSLRVRHNWATSLWLFTFLHWRRKWQPTPVFLRGESQGQGSLVGCHLWGRTESDTTEAT